jgi:hypothetical protein
VGGLELVGFGRYAASVGYGTIDLDRFGLVGNTKTLLKRLQWIY